MADQFPRIEADHRDFIERQQMFFVATAAADGRVNLSPKGQDTLRVIDDQRVHWLNLTGSGNETAAHLLENDRMTLMFCSFEKKPLILRLYGQARCVHVGDQDWDELSAPFGQHTGARQVYDLTVDLVQTSCGFAVPRYDFVEARDTLTRWADNRGEDGIREYWRKKNQESLDGLPTGVPVGDAAKADS
ncbi:MAG: pyridoxamine 5'-phosphate oxidase family protein [Acidobacteriota bacterium]